jgi:hypothetical protein
MGKGVKRPGREVDHSLPCNAEVKNDGAIPPLPHKSSWRGAKLKYNFTIYLTFESRIESQTAYENHILKVAKASASNRGQKLITPWGAYRGATWIPMARLQPSVGPVLKSTVKYAPSL